MNWDGIITSVIIIALILGFWAKMSHQTIPELFSSIKEMIADKGEDSVEYAGEVIEYV